MRFSQLLATAPFLGLLAACHGAAPADEAAAPAPRAQVQVVQPATQSLTQYRTFPATSTYPRKSAVTAPVAGYITGVNVRLGDRVTAGQVLFTLETKERRALGNSITRIDPSLKGFGLVSVTAPSPGIVSVLNIQQSGDYLLEGSPLATVAESSQLVFQLNLPYEYNQIAQGNPLCTIVLPDSTRLQGRVESPLASVSPGQSEIYLVRPINPQGVIPENLIVQVRLTQTRQPNAQVLPAGCVLSDETLHSFWVMKLVNDSTAVKVPVTLGVQKPDEIEIKTPVFGPHDRILSAGNYGLADTAKVKVVK
ncbi:HlyD family efflux transporter periplasmic adaptor subunit [Hymenobacter sp. RP-2-7]|uniref:HlyD family efflux transporter periplasmic adaptor subunit n=1 Tax=Hymenobacter polaris TaxID=2682546 RepID=A0A7Y0FLI4_9BACT|nr:HlyD family efflux transporter periplasmic adaptor subunit [Hymenobacter polaris]NML64424.1 HlyD family efflux transporter periplasmic adaptor subunit [Hymenobacter polaris]